MPGVNVNTMFKKKKFRRGEKSCPGKTAVWKMLLGTVKTPFKTWIICKNGKSRKKPWVLVAEMYHHSRWIRKDFEAWLPEGLKADDRNLHKTWGGREPAGRLRGWAGGGRKAVRDHHGQVQWISAQEFTAEVGPTPGWVRGTVPRWDLSKNVFKANQYKLQLQIARPRCFCPKALWGSLV